MVDAVQLQSRASCLGILYFVLGGLSIFLFVLVFIAALFLAIVFVWAPILYFFLAVKSRQMGQFPTLQLNRSCLILAILLVVFNSVFGILTLVGSITSGLYAGIVFALLYFAAASVAVASIVLSSQFKEVLNNPMAYPLGAAGDPAQQGQAYTGVIAVLASQPGYQQGVPAYQQGVPAYQQGVPAYQQGVPAYPQGPPAYQQGPPVYQQAPPAYPPDPPAGPGFNQT